MNQVEQMQDARRALQAHISAAVQNFTDKTGLIVTKIDVPIIDVSTWRDVAYTVGDVDVQVAIPR